ncbi:hypothetical protein [Thalassotalea profundi]|uniref:DUF3306 domain-containing protein n=1 Tax=Thalassotalea profundi TaxID=2036687 RepID=A0ABQ3IPE6_9GAMM|nr:hypothetical protein [Thalassotalea profundi]GHE87426.1 hypothetical protein GCM10011501_16110 [Thalassotalea profundi]
MSLQKPEVNETESEKAESFTETLAKENEEKYQYNHLDEYEKNLSFVSGGNTESETETVEESEQGESETESSNQLVMQDDDAAVLAAFGVNTVNSFLPTIFKAPVSMSDEQQEDIALKAVPLVKKYYSGDDVPDWLKKYQDEFAFGLALGGALFGCNQQAKAFKKEQALIASKQKETEKEEDKKAA